MSTTSRIGPIAAMFLVAGNMVGSGIYLLPASLAAIGSISLFGWLLATLGVLVVALLFVHVAANDPRGGFLGTVEQAFGQPTAVVAGTFYWLQAFVGNVAIALAVTGYIGFFWPVAATQPGTALITAAVIWLFVALNLFGPARVAAFGSAMLLVGLAPVLLVGTLGWASFDPAIFRASWNVSGASAPAAALQSVTLILWAFLGFETACAVGAQVRDPARNVPRAILGGLLIAAALYLAAATAISGIVPAQQLARSSAPFADATVLMVGSWAGALVALSAAAKASGTLGGWLFVTAETARGLGQIGRPQSAGPSVPSARNHLLTGLASTLILAASAAPTIAGQFGFLINAVVVLMLITYAIVGAAVVRLQPHNPRARALGAATALLALAVVATQPAEMLLIALAGLLASLAMVARSRRPLPA